MQRCLQTQGADITKGDFDRIFFALLVASSFFAVERVRLIASTINWRLSCQRFYALVHWQKVGTASLENGTDGVCAFLQLCIRANFDYNPLFTFDTGHLRMEFLYYILIV